ncbi:MAG: hypothetical protein QXH27_05930 [Candidatus Micrarchaeia archaeon]
MRAVLLLLAIASTVLAFYQNPTLPDVLAARASFAACRIDYAINNLNSISRCYSENGASPPDFSLYTSALQADKSALQSAANRSEFQAALDRMRSDLQAAFQAVRGLRGQPGLNASQRAAVLACARSQRSAHNATLGGCISSAIEAAKAASKSFINNQITRANEDIANLSGRGIDTAALSALVGGGNGLLTEVDAVSNAFGFHSIALQDSRLAVNYRLERILAILRWAQPQLAASNNTNKDEIVSRMGALQGTVQSTLAQCPVSSDTSDPEAYREKNSECWSELRTIAQEAQAIRELVRTGR